ncbi:MAG TPA: hypothetical protein VHF89_00925 [Solirubrobacteraceae bacterium]|nr:hypothetical protein [Solirubrobacteraceae bacterium]
MSIRSIVPLALVATALAAPAAATAGTPTQAACNATVWVGEGSVRHGTYEVTTPEQTVRLADHTGALGDQDPCVA